MSRQLRTGTGWLLALLAGATLAAPGRALAQGAGSERGSTTVVVAGDPALTRGMLVRLADFIEWLVDSPLTAEQRTKLEAVVADSWRQHKQSDIDGAKEILKYDEQIAAMPDAQRELVRAQLQPPMLKALRDDANDPVSQWLLAIYESAHQPLAAGSSPLTRQISDAQAELCAFVASEAVGQPITADAQFKDGWAQRMVQVWPTVPAEKQAEWAKSPATWAAVRAWWAKADAASKQKMRAEWKQAFAGSMAQLAAKAEMDKGLADLGQVMAIKNTRELTPAEIDRAAGDLDHVASALRKGGGSTSDVEAVTQAAAQLRQAAQEAKRAAQTASSGAGHTTTHTSSTAPSGGHGLKVATTFASIQARSMAFQAAMNAQMQAHYAQFNAINRMGGNSMRYVNGYGHEY